MAETYDMGATEAPDNKEKEFLKPGYRKLTVKKFEYSPAQGGKTPLILLKMEGIGESGDPVEFTERLYVSGKVTNGTMAAITRLQELYKGLTGNPKMTIQPSKFNYSTKDKDGNPVTYTIPNPQEITEYLNTTCVGTSGIFKVGADEADNGKLFSKLVYSGFLYYTDKGGNLCRYTQERDFDDSEAKFNIKKKEAPTAPAGGGGLSHNSALDDL